MVFNFYRIFFLLLFIVLFIFLISDVSYAVEISSDPEYEKGSNKNKGIILFEEANALNPVIDKLDPRIKFLGGSGGIDKLGNEFPHTKYIANISKPATVIMPTSLAIPEENFYIVDPKSTEGRSVDFYEQKGFSYRGVFFAKVLTKDGELSWHYFYGDVNSKIVSIISLEPIYSNLLDDYYADNSKFIPTRNQTFHSSIWSFRKNLGDVALTTSDNAISKVIEYKSWVDLDVVRLHNELPKYTGMHTHILSKTTNTIHGYGPDSLPTFTFKLPVSYDKMLLSNQGYDSLCYSHKFIHSKFFQQQHAYNHCMHILKQIFFK